MEAIVVSIISGFFSLVAIWYQNYLQKKPYPVNNETNLSNEAKIKKHNQLSFSLRIIFTLIIVVCPFLLLLTIGKERLSDGDKYLWEYYFVWLVITFLAIVFGWKIKTLFEKIILIASFVLLIFMTISVMNGI